LKNKLFLLLAGTVLSVSMLAGCNNNDNDQNPAPPVNDEVDTPLDDDNNNDNNLNNKNTRYNNNNGLNNTNTRYNNNDNNGLNNTNTRYNNNNGLNDNNYPVKEDINTPHDKDPVKDRNTPREDIIEDDIDMRDRDKKDE
jgi:outer membrane murein-binding lipoprotein Lpp